jgi:uncharacterized protein (TIGR00661 family)
MTQALAFQQWCRRNGHQVVRVLAGHNPSRNWPDFFSQGFDVPVEPIASPGLSYRNGRRMDLAGTLWQACRRSRAFLASFRAFDAALAGSRPDGIVNFLEPLAGIHHWLRRPDVPQLSIGHQFMLNHPDYPTAPGLQLASAGVRAFSQVAAGRDGCYALSFYSARNLPDRRIRVGPPLLREEVTQLPCSDQGYLLIYLLNAGYRPEIERWHWRNPGIPIHCFYDRPAADGTESMDPNLHFHPLHGGRFLQRMAECRGVVCSAGFESIAEAASMGKPILAVPVEGHFEQQLNGIDASRSGLAVTSTTFDLDRLLQAESRPPNERFREWLMESDRRLDSALRDAVSRRFQPARGSFQAAPG